MKAHTEVIELQGAPDACALYAHLASHRSNTLLLESTDGDGRNDTQSLLLIQSALRVEARGQSVHLCALTAGGEAALDTWPASEFGTAERRGSTLHLELEAVDLGGDHLQRLRAPSTVDVLRHLTRAWDRSGDTDWPLHLAGVFAYDLVEQRETLPEARADRHHFPDYVFYLPELVVRVDHHCHRTQILTHRYGDGPPVDPALLQKTRAAITSSLSEPAGTPGPVPPVTVDQDDADFQHTVRRCKEHIAAGDVFQIVPSRTFVTPCPEPLAAYAALRQLNPSPYLFFVQGDDFCLFGASPEACVRVRDGQVQLHPIAGTRPRGRTTDSIDADLDSRLEAELRLDDKELSEHMMLVDLARNDVARICQAGTRRVARLLEVARYSHVMHLCSTVEGTLHSGLDGLHAYLASANMGTLVGAPKVEAATLLRRYEPDRRGPYGGAVGFYTDQDELETAIVIRAALVRDGKAYVRAGAGVVQHSDPAAEAQETRAKAGAVLRAIALAHSHPGGQP